MSTAAERNRALIWAGGFFIELAHDERLPIEVRRRAVSIARHFPTIESVAGPTTGTESRGGAATATDTRLDPAWLADLQRGPLKDSTRLRWPEDAKPAGQGT